MSIGTSFFVESNRQVSRGMDIAVRWCESRIVVPQGHRKEERLAGYDAWSNLIKKGSLPGGGYYAKYRQIDGNVGNNVMLWCICIILRWFNSVALIYQLMHHFPFNFFPNRAIPCILA